ncbi:hypothetical protein A7L45_10175 [Clostridium estertheticum subsp. estertheticum]|uniref:Uncharacterized protein n=1 Tax=Clostridium estertheticum subsp. estertheticum TaxID=1552 RepID=A0A1J0GGG0_9CLOT|nr:hypothetical protein A7L45_10175 [Clostridium estertheticum subsp. estertheticum]
MFGKYPTLTLTASPFGSFDEQPENVPIIDIPSNNAIENLKTFEFFIWSPLFNYFIIPVLKYV